MEWLKNNVSVLITILTLSAGGYGTFIRLQSELEILQTKINVIEKDGTEKQRVLENKVSLLEVQNSDLAQQMKEQKEVLNKIDKRVGYLLCKTEKRFCVE
jgi:hypothetical protein